jgi:hypothetical protein
MSVSELAMYRPLIVIILSLAIGCRAHLSFRPCLQKLKIFPGVRPVEIQPVDATLCLPLRPEY